LRKLQAYKMDIHKDFHEHLMRKKSVQIESKTAQLS